MKLELLESEKGQVKLQVAGETHTLLNLIRESSWKQGVDKAVYILKHPYMSQPELTIKSKDPLKSLTEATQEILEQTKELEKELKGAFKK